MSHQNSPQFLVDASLFQAVLEREAERIDFVFWSRKQCVLSEELVKRAGHARFLLLVTRKALRKFRHGGQRQSHQWHGSHRGGGLDFSRIVGGGSGLGQRVS